MKIHLFILSFLIMLTACSNLAKQPALSSQQAQQAQSIENASPDTNVVTDSDTPSVIIASKNANIEPQKPTSDTEEATKAIEQVEPIDIWQRMRQGYRLPTMDSKFIAKYENWNRKHSNYVTKMLQRGDKYLFHIVEQIEKRNMPMEIALLPAIESAYRAKARSRSNASGLWQFIPATGRYLGMRQDWWSDQRRDILISTEAALDYLQSLHAQFKGDWLMALAAYNGGKGTISKAIRLNQRQNKPTNLENLSLRQETTLYVPKLIALSNVVMNPDLYNIKLPAIANAPYFAVQEIPGQTDLIRLVKGTDLSREDIDDLNPSFLRWASDPKGPHRIIIPIQHQASVVNFLETAPSVGQLNWREHHIREGETISQIARKYSTNISAIRSINGMKNNNIRAGKTILIPLKATITSYSKQQSKTTVQSSHQVKRGDTLWEIARRYNLSVSDLISWNNISKNQTLNLDQIIKLTNH